MSLLIYEDITVSLVKSLIKALKAGNKKVRTLFYISLISILLGIVSALLAELFTESRSTFNIIGAGFGIIAIFIIFGISGYASLIEETKVKEKIETIEKRASEHPTEARAAWDLARIKLESYLNRNLIHIRWIFILILFVMFVGFAIVVYGIIKIYESPETITPSIVTLASGVLIEFIASSFLIIYRSTMNQAKEYVNVLERINAVGMSVQILESIDKKNTKLKDQTRSELVKELLSLYKTKIL